MTNKHVKIFVKYCTSSIGCLLFMSIAQGQRQHMSIWEQLYKTTPSSAKTPTKTPYEQLVHEQEVQQQILKKYSELTHGDAYNAGKLKVLQAVRAFGMGKYQEAFADYAAALPLLHQAYSSVGYALDPDDISNYTSSAFRGAVQAGFQDLSTINGQITQQRANKKNYDALIGQFGVRLKKYATQIATLSTYFNIPATQALLYQAHARRYYAQQFNPLIFQVYSQALNDLVAQLPVPTQGGQNLDDAYYAHRIAVAKDYFDRAQAVWSSELTVYGYPNQQAARRALYQNLGTLYFYAAQNALMTMGLDSEKDIKDTITRASADFGQAATLYFASADPQLTALAQSYNNFATNLQAGAQAWDAAQHAQAIHQQITLYQQAYTALFAGNAQWLAQRADRLHKIAQGSQASLQGSLTLSSFIKKYQASLKSYYTALTSTQQQEGISEFALNFFSDLAAACSDAYTAYQQALGFYNQALESSATVGILLEHAHVVRLTQLVAHITSAQIVLDNLGQGGTILAQALAGLIAQPANSALIRSTQATVSQIIRNNFQRADAHYNDNPVLSFYRTLRSATKPTMTITVLVQQLVAAVYQELAAQIAAQPRTPVTQALLYSYYVYAYAYNQTPELLDKLKESNALGRAQEALAVAQKQTDWASTASSELAYTSPADQAWQEALIRCFVAYSIWASTRGTYFSGARELYLQCIQKYAHAVEQYAPVDADPILTAAFLRYRAYVVYAAEKNQAQQAHMISLIQPAVHALFNQAQDLKKQATQVSQISQAGYTAQIQAQKKLISWGTVRYQRALTLQNKALSDQQTVTPQLATQEVLILQEPQIATDGSITFTTGPASSSTLSLVLSNPTITLANVYKAQGDFERLQNNHEAAAQAYAQAQTLYGSQPDPFTPSISQLWRTESILAYADALYKSVVGFAPNTTEFTGFTVYARYFLSPYLQVIPQQNFSMPEALRTLWAQISPAPSQEQCIKIAQNSNLLNNLILLAMALYMHNALMANGLASTLSPTDYYAVLLGQDTGVASQSIQEYSTQARDYGQRLRRLITMGIDWQGSKLKTCLLLYNPQQNLEYLLYLNKPVTIIPEVVNATIWEPTALSYYTLAASTYTQGGDAQAAARMQQQENIAYLSHAYTLKKKIDAVLGREKDQNLLGLITSGPEELALLTQLRTTLIGPLPTSLTPHLINALEIALDYYGAVISDMTQLTASPSSMISFFTGQAYEEPADFLRSYLIGDPQQSQYQAYVTQINTSYLFAQTAYTQANRLDAAALVGQKRADLFEHIGDLFMSKQDYLTAAPYYRSAQNAYQLLVLENIMTQAALQAAQNKLQLKIMEAEFKAATAYVRTYHDQRTGTITVRLSTGALEQLSFEQLQQRYQEGQAGGQIDPAEYTAYTTLQSTLLDALIYYQSVTMLAQGLSTNSNPTAQERAQWQEVLTTYLKQQTILPPGTTITDVLARTSGFTSITSEQLASFLNDGYTFLTTPLRQTQVTAADYARALGAFILWTNSIIEALSTWYITDYLGGVAQDQQIADLLSALTVEQNQLFAPADQYLGAFGTS